MIETRDTVVNKFEEATIVGFPQGTQKLQQSKLIKPPLQFLVGVRKVNHSFLPTKR
jgi:hypothetical protein